MKKVLALAAVAFVCAALIAVAGDDKMGSKGKMGKAAEGTITKVDMAGKMMMVKDADGKETEVYWNDSTKVQGEELKEGAKVHYKATEKDGKMWATWVHVGEMKGKM
jgi:YD repeat-containing protein